MSGLVGQATSMLRASGGRMTEQRQLILETLENMGGHPTADDIFAAVVERDPSINESTVYRTLHWLEEAGLVSPLRLGVSRDESRRERFDPALPAGHHHFVCTECGQVTEFDSPLVERAIEEFQLERRVAVVRATMTLYGLCARCRG